MRPDKSSVDRCVEACGGGQFNSPCRNSRSRGVYRGTCCFCVVSRSILGAGTGRVSSCGCYSLRRWVVLPGRTVPRQALRCQRARNPIWHTIV
jgi:hypothetical protein